MQETITRVEEVEKEETVTYCDECSEECTDNECYQVRELCPDCRDEDRSWFWSRVKAMDQFEDEAAEQTLDAGLFEMGFFTVAAPLTIPLTLVTTDNSPSRMLLFGSCLGVAGYTTMLMFVLL